MWRVVPGLAVSAQGKSVDSLSVPGEPDLEDFGTAQLVGLAGLLHGTKRRPAQVEVRLDQARTNV